VSIRTNKLKRRKEKKKEKKRKEKNKPPAFLFLTFPSMFTIDVQAVFLSTRITESPLRNILLMKRSLLMGFAPFPLAP